MTIGFFAPLPLPIMIPFMAMQSAAMANAFGTFFQYGKRKISSMTNEDFNKLTPDDLTQMNLQTTKDMIPHLETSFKQMDELNRAVLHAFGDFIGNANEVIKERAEDTSISITESAQNPDLIGSPANIIKQYQDEYKIISDELAKLKITLPSLPSARATSATPVATSTKPIVTDSFTKNFLMNLNLQQLNDLLLRNRNKQITLTTSQLSTINAQRKNKLRANNVGSHVDMSYDSAIKTLEAEIAQLVKNVQTAQQNLRNQQLNPSSSSATQAGQLKHLQDRVKTHLTLYNRKREEFKLITGFYPK